ncbi:hypothetical protein TL16_g01404 [Triparma laevis f. inornata]|uniref:Uncharacterized protein n=1 Tax=Triparma laevis f. inornata TaxID=1714386 RepID=A0A9W6ZL06_9STRA|nr:hypothetical protein TL16_g01404 [Triparma laevis f. inornata]
MAEIPPPASHPPQSTSPTLEDLAGSPPLISPSSSSPSQPVPSGPPPADESDDKASPNSRTGLHLRARAKKILAKSTSVIARSEGKATLFEKCTKDDFSLDDVVLHLSKNPKDITGVGEYGQTLLHQLCGYGGSVPTLVVKEIAADYPSALSLKDSHGETPIELAKKNPAMQQSTVEMLTYLSAGDIKVLQSYPDLLNAIEQKKKKNAKFLSMKSSMGSLSALTSTLPPPPQGHVGPYEDPASGSASNPPKTDRRTSTQSLLLLSLKSSAEKDALVTSLRAEISNLKSLLTLDPTSQQREILRLHEENLRLSTLLAKKSGATVSPIKYRGGSKERLGGRNAAVRDRPTSIDRRLSSSGGGSGSGSYFIRPNKVDNRPPLSKFWMSNTSPKRSTSPIKPLKVSPRITGGTVSSVRKSKTFTHNINTKQIDSSSHLLTNTPSKRDKERTVPDRSPNQNSNLKRHPNSPSSRSPKTREQIRADGNNFMKSSPRMSPTATSKVDDPYLFHKVGPTVKRQTVAGFGKVANGGGSVRKLLPPHPGQLRMFPASPKKGAGNSPSGFSGKGGSRLNGGNPSRTSPKGGGFKSVVGVVSGYKNFLKAHKSGGGGGGGGRWKPSAIRT